MRKKIPRPTPVALQGAVPPPARAVHREALRATARAQAWYLIMVLVEMPANSEPLAVPRASIDDGARCEDGVFTVPRLQGASSRPRTGATGHRGPAFCSLPFCDPRRGGA